MKRALAALVLALQAGALLAQGADLGEAERRAILRHGPWPMAWTPDPSNRVSGKAPAIEMGERLFFDPRLSASGKVLCATCHAPYRAWQDGRQRGFGLAEGERNTSSLFDLRHGRWFGWDGAQDSLWAQSLRPILDEREMAGSVKRTAALLRDDPELRCRYQRSFGAAPAGSDEALFADAGKALAAFQETLVSGRSPFDDFRDALAAGNAAGTAAYPPAALRGLRLFVGRGNCTACHVGPAFTNGEFHDTGVPFFVAGGGVDPGRHRGISRLRDNPYNLTGRFSDDRAGESSVKTRHVRAEHRNFGEFKTPSLRNVALTAPYMHNGSLPTLASVVKHYSELSADRLHQDGEALLLRPLRLTEAESADLVAFLESLTERAPALAPRRPMRDCRAG